ncbi:MAG: phage tail tip lysozyme [Acidobacteriota bacterium]
MGWWTASRKNYALNYLLSAGLSPYGAAGLVSRWANVESTGSGPSSVNPYSGAFGIAQWLGSRLPPIRGNTNFDAQLTYVIQELNGPESRAANVLRNANTAYEGARGASIYERAEGYNPSTGVDNFTARTASGIPAILGSGYQPAPDVYVNDAPAEYPDYGTRGVLVSELPSANVFDWSLLPVDLWPVADDYSVGAVAEEQQSISSTGLIISVVAAVLVISWISS